MTELVSGRKGIFAPASLIALAGAVGFLITIGVKGGISYAQHAEDVRRTEQLARTALVMLCGMAEVAEKNQATCAVLRPYQSVPVQAVGAR